MPLQPSRRDSAGPRSVIRHHESHLRGLDPGFLGGRFATPQPVQGGPSPLVGGDEGGGDADESAVIGEDGDRLILTHLGNQTWTLSYTPTAETIHIRWLAAGGAGVEWKRGEHYSIDDDDQVVTIYASTLASAKAEVGDVFSAQYLRVDGEQNVEVLLDEFFVDSRSSSVLTGPVLDDGDYRIEILGTFTVVDTITTGSTIPLIYPSVGGPGFATSDVEWRFGYGPPDTGPFPHILVGADVSLQYRHGAAGAWIKWAPTTTEPNAERTYEREIAGQGQAIEFQFSDTAYSDNDGQIRVRVYQP